MQKKLKANPAIGNVASLENKTLVVMGTHPKGQKLFDWRRQDCEIWMFNEAPNIKDKEGNLLYPRTDVFFQLHHESIWKNPGNRSDKKHYEWLTKGATPIVYMQKKYKEIPRSVEYPLKEVLAIVKNIKIISNGQKKDFKYFSSTPDFAFGLIAYLWKTGKRYKAVEIYGIELEMESEYVYQRMGFGFWIGYLASLGVPLKIYSSIFNNPVYGYEGDIAITTADFEKRITELNLEIGDEREKYVIESKAFTGKIPALANGDTSNEIEKELNELIKASEHAGIASGKINEATRYLGKAKEMERITGTSIFSPGEFDDVRMNYSKQYDQVRIEAMILNARIAELVKRLVILKKGSGKRKRAVDEFGNLVAELLNKNMLLFHIVGGIQENQFYLDSFHQSIKFSKKGSI